MGSMAKTTPVMSALTASNGVHSTAAVKKEAGCLSAQAYNSPELLKGLKVLDVPLKLATNENLKGLGYVVDDPKDFTVEKGTFEIVSWPVQGWRSLDPETGNEGGTTEGGFDIFWKGDTLRGQNNSIATTA